MISEARNHTKKSLDITYYGAEMYVGVRQDADKSVISIQAPYKRITPAQARECGKLLIRAAEEAEKEFVPK